MLIAAARAKVPRDLASARLGLVGAVVETAKDTAILSVRVAARRQVVFVDISASWWLTCKVNELTVLERTPVADKLREPSVVAMGRVRRAPTRRSPPTCKASAATTCRSTWSTGPEPPPASPCPELLTSGAVVR